MMLFSSQGSVVRGQGLVLTLCFVFCLLHTLCYAQSVSSTELINNAKIYDGKTVAYEGEVIGDVMARGEFVWINLNDASNAIGVWIQKGLTREILYSGSYKSRGDWVEVIGKFNRACPEHGGDLDIHAQSIRKISPGKPLKEGLNTGKRNFVFILSGILCLILILSFLKLK